MEPDQNQTVAFKKVQKRLDFLPEKCTGCGSCELMCALYREGVGGPVVARCHIGRDPFNAQFSLQTCRQCLAPSCYVVCPERDKAIVIEEKTGVRYINEEECIGCKLCIKACPFEIPRVLFNSDKKKAYKCDLCYERPEGPVCVEYCPTGALSLVVSKKLKKTEEAENGNS